MLQTKLFFGGGHVGLRHPDTGEVRFLEEQEAEWGNGPNGAKLNC